MMMKWFLNIIGVILFLVGIVWFLQGLNVLLGSFMSGNSLYTVLGALLAVVGIIILVFTNRKRRAAKDGENSDTNLKT
jgi:LPXTG-motif cell wall-anchored protein